METRSNQRRKTETAILDSRGRPVQLLYDEANDKTIMARSTESGELTTTDRDLYWNQYRYEYDGSDNVIYKGKHEDYDALSNDPNYFITKYTYSGSNIIRKQTAEGSWDNRTLLGW